MTKHYLGLNQQIAIFRYGLIADLVQLPPGAKGLHALIRQKADKDYAIPGSRRNQVAAETIRDWLKKYRKGGFDALIPKERRDKGLSRRLPQEVADSLLAKKEEHPDLSVAKLIKEVVNAELVPDHLMLAPSTVHKLLFRHGLMQKSPEDPSANDHLRFTYSHAGELFMSDVMHGPAVRTPEGRKRKTFLIAFIDDATRVIPYAAFALSESTAAFLPVLKQAIMRRGIPVRLFVDNGAAFRSQHLELVCAKLGITLIHARAYHPQAKGKIERWFRTVRLQFLPTLSEANTKSLTDLNRALITYVETEYHRSPHRMLAESPLDRWAKVGHKVRYPEPGLDLDDLFLFEAKRKVHKDRTVSLDGLVYEVDAALVNETVTLRYDPATQLNQIQIWHKGRHEQDAKLVDVYANCFVKRNRPSQDLTVIAPADKQPDLPPPRQPKHTVNFTKLSE